MQSPINVLAPDSSPEAITESNFKIDYKFSDIVPVKIMTNVEEIYLHFEDFAGGIKIEYGEGGFVSFAIKKLAFRFPAEHLINGYRLDGEIVLLGDEITDNNNLAVALTNGIEFVIPLQFNTDAPEYSELNNLNPDLWRTEVTATGSYIPKDSLSGKISTFNLQGFFDKVMELKSDFSLYLGSATTPPCQGKYID